MKLKTKLSGSPINKTKVSIKNSIFQDLRPVSVRTLFKEKSPEKSPGHQTNLHLSLSSFDLIFRKFISTFR